MSKKGTNQVANRVRLTQIPHDAIRNARVTVVESAPGFDETTPGDMPADFAEDVNDALDALGIGRTVRLDAA